MKYIALILIGLFLYLPSLPNKFVWDDEEQVVANTAVHSVTNIPSLLAGSTFNSGGAANLGGLYYKPLMSVSFAVIYTFFGPRSWAFHLFQIGLHIGSTCLLYIVFKKLWKNEWLALVLSILFLIHPQNVETVVYISSLQDTLYMFFGMLGLTWIVISDRKITVWDFVFAGTCVFLALLGKETGGLFGIIIGAYIVLFHKKIDAWKWILTLFVVYGLYLYMRIGVAHVGLGKNMFTPMATLPLVTRLGNIPSFVWHYLSQFVWPAELSISQHWANRTPGIWEWLSIVGLVGTWLGVLWYGMKNKLRNPPSGETGFVFFWMWFGMVMAFHMQIFPLDMTVADRWFYLPMVGMLGACGSLVKGIKFRSPARSVYDTVVAGGLANHARIGTIAMVIVLIALFVRSSIRIKNWRDGLTLYTHDIVYMPESFDLQNNLGVELFRNGKYDEAKIHFEISTEITPMWWTNWNNLGAITEREGELDLAIDYYNKAIVNGGYYLAYPNYAKVLLKQGKITEAQRFLKSSLDVFPYSSDLLELYQYSLYTQN